MTPAQADEIIRLIPGFLWLAGLSDAARRDPPQPRCCGRVPDFEGEGTLVLRRRKRR